MVEMQIQENKPEKEATITTINVNELIGKVRDFVDNFKEMSGAPMDVSVDSFNFSAGKINDEFDLTFNTKISIKPK